ncbi:MAG: TonB-dependent receptor [Candidatus Aminicenantes bacterium]|nr:TonB-dependent receptor [Candidatus Aminicenantes bacterium]
MKKMPLFMLILLILAVPAVPAAAPGIESGTIYGRVTDLDGNPLPGASVALMGVNLMGMNSHVTSATGQFFFPLLAPGVYEIRIEMPGFKIQLQSGLAVRSGRATQIHVRLEETAVDEEVAVAALDQIIDTRNTTHTAVFGPDAFTGVPLARELYAFWTLISGAVPDLAGDRRFVSVNGSSPQSQSVFLEGAPINDPVTGIPVIHPMEDAIAEVVSLTAGKQAAANTADGAQLQIITHRGGNAFDGGLSYYATGGSLAQKPEADPSGTLRTQPPDRYEGLRDLSFHLGGSLMEDRAWIYLAGRWLSSSIANPYSPEKRLAGLGLPETDSFNLDQRQWTGFGRLTIKATDTIKYSGLFHFQSARQPYDFEAVADNAASDRIPERNPENAMATTHNFNITVNQNTQADLHAFLVSHRFSLKSRTEEGASGVYDASRQVWWGSPDYNLVSKNQTLGASAALTHFREDLIGADHEFRLGLEYVQADAHRDWYRANPFNDYWYDYAARNPYYYDGISQGRLEIIPAPNEADVWDVNEQTRKVSAFVQDTLTKKRLSFNVGLRFDFQTLTLPSQYRNLSFTTYEPAVLSPDVSGSEFLAALDEDLAEQGTLSPLSSVSSAFRRSVSFITLSPRAGLTFDLFGNGRAAVKLSFARSHEPLWVSGYDQGQIFEPQTLAFVWRDLNGDALMDLPGTDEYSLLSFRLQTESLDYYTDATPPRVDELSGAFDIEAARNLRLGLRITYRKTSNILEDIDTANGSDPLAVDDVGRIWLPLTVTDPGYDGLFGTQDDKSLTVYGLRADRPTPAWKAANRPDGYRKYRSATLTLEKRLADNWMLNGSVTLSSLRGNADFAAPGRLYRTDLFNSPNSLINTEGPLAYDRPLQAKVQALYVFPFNISLGAYFQFYSGAPWARTVSVYFPAGYMGYGTAEPYVTVYAEPWGTRRAPAISCLDLYLEKSFALKKDAKLSVTAAVFNAAGWNSQTISADAAGVIDWRNSPGTYTVTNESGRVVRLYGARQFRLGIRLDF